jgi:hypothetical protein
LRETLQRGAGSSPDYIHIDWSEGTVSDRTADSTRKGEAGVEGKTLGLLLGGDRRQGSGRGSHCGRKRREYTRTVATPNETEGKGERLRAEKEKSLGQRLIIWTDGDGGGKILKAATADFSGEIKITHVGWIAHLLAHRPIVSIIIIITEQVPY